MQNIIKRIHDERFAEMQQNWADNVPDLEDPALATEIEAPAREMPDLLSVPKGPELYTLGDLLYALAADDIEDRKISKE